MGSTTISKGTITTDNVNVTYNTVSTSLSVRGDAQINGKLTVAGRDIISTIDEHASALENHSKLIGGDNPHLTVAEHEKFNKIAQLFEDVESDVPAQPEFTPTVTGGTVIPDEWFLDTYFKENAEPNTWPVNKAPGRVYVSRVPYGVKNPETDTLLTGSDASALRDSIVYDGLATKLMDNTDLVHVPSTDTIEGQDDYVGKEYVFYWNYGNFIRDEFGNKHIVSVENSSPTWTDTTGTAQSAKAFTKLQDTASFGPVFWFFCKVENYTDAEGNKLVYPGTDLAYTQLWGISDRPWDTIDEDSPLYNGIVYDGLDDSRKAELLAHGITKNDFHIWPSSLVWTGEKYVIRPYWCEAAFCGGYVEGHVGMASCTNAPLWTNISFSSIHSDSIQGNSPSMAAGGSQITGLANLFGIVKTANKNSQTYLSGNTDNAQSSVLAAYSTNPDTPGYIFPISSKGNFEVGCSVRLWQTNGNYTSVNYKPSYTCQHGRISAIETRTFLTADSEEISSLCLIIDPASDTCNPIQPFIVCTTIDDAKAYTDQGIYACCYANQYFAIAGETYNGGVNGTGVIGKHDGSVTSNSNSKHPYRIQGIEYHPGVVLTCCDTSAFVGDGVTEVTVRGTGYTNFVGTEDLENNVTTYTPTDEEAIYVYIPTNKTKVTSGDLTTAIINGWEVIGIGNKSGGFIINTQMSPTGFVYPVLTGGNSTTGHGDNFNANISNWRAVICDGDNVSNASGGLASVFISNPLSHTNYRYASRL